MREKDIIFYIDHFGPRAEILAWLRAHALKEENLLDTAERLILHDAIRIAAGNQSHAAELIGIHPVKMMRKLRAYGATRKEKFIEQGQEASGG